MALRGGFRVPNAATYAPDYQTAQPDQGDYLILGNGQFGVVYGCEVTLAGSTVSIGNGPHIVVLDGAPQLILPNSSSGLATGGPRFDLVVYSATEGFSVVTGVVSDNPVFPDVTDAMVVLAAVFTPSSGTRRLIDKRNFLQTNVTGRGTASSLLRGYSTDGATVQVNIDASGKITWNGDTTLERYGAGILEISNELRVDTLTVGSTLTVGGNTIITDAKIAWGPVADRPASADVGTIWVDTGSGDVTIVRTDVDLVDKWMSLPTAVPTGTKLESFLDPASMPGWLHLDGSLKSRADVGGLWDLLPSWQRPGDLFQLPDTRGRVSVGAGFNGGGAGVYYGTPVNGGGAVEVSVEVANMPGHSHRSGSSTSIVGDHTHTGSAVSGGSHSHTISGGSHVHDVTDVGHFHLSMGNADLAVTHIKPGETPTHEVPVWSGNAFSSGLFIRPGITNNTSNSPSGIYVSGGGHEHTMASGGSHSHTITVNAGGSHSHTLPTHNSVGGDQPLVVGPAAITTYHYIKL